MTRADMDLSESKRDAEVSTVRQNYTRSWIKDDDHNPEAVVLLVQPCAGRNITLEFRLPSQYPAAVPDIAVTSDCLTKTSTNDLQRLLELKTSEMVGHPVLLILLREAEEFLQASGLTDKTACQDGTKPKEKKRQIGKKKSQSRNNRIEYRDESPHPNDNEVRKCTSERSKEKKSKKKKRREYYDSDDSDSENISSDLHHKISFTPHSSKESTELSSHVVYCDPDDPLSKRPTHFIAVRITDEKIVRSLQGVQAELVEKEPLLEKGMFAGETFHITLCTLGLDTNEQEQQCVTALEGMKADLKTVLPLTPITVYSMSQFYNRAIYAMVRYGDDLLKFREVLRNKFGDYGVEIRDDQTGFTPHVTIIKVKRPERKLFGSRNIKASMYSHVLEVTHGDQQFDALYLCCMGGQKRDDGFYRTLHELHFQ